MKNFFHRDILFSTLLVFLFMFILRFVIINIHFLDPFHNALKDFEINDIIFSRLKDNHKGIADNNIILVNIGNNSREEIARQINIINRYEPAVLAVDITFEELKDSYSDSLLASALNDSRNLILAGYFNYSNPGGSKQKGYDSFIESESCFSLQATTGFTNFVTAREETTIRYFIKNELFHDQTYEAFPVVIAKYYNYEKYESFIKRKKKVEIINYSGNIDRYISLDVNDVTHDNPLLSVIKDKIVILGFLGPDLETKVFEDIHFTPMNPEYSGRSFPDMYGAVIHANIVSMILSESYINRMPSWLIYIISFIICYIHMYFFAKHFVQRNKWYHRYYLYAKLAQLLTAFIIVGISVYCFARFQYQIKTFLIILPIILSFDLLYLYDAIVKILNRLFGYKTYFLNQ